MKKMQTSNQERSNVQGFTLIEILIALTIFAIIATITASSMYYAFNIRTRVKLEAERLFSLQLALTILERDIMQTANRPVRANDMRLYSAFIGQPHYVEFTRSGMPNPQNLKKQSTLERIALICQKNQLIRRSWLSLDVRSRGDYHDKILLKNLSGCHFRFLNNNLHVLAEWQGDAMPAIEAQETFPKAIQFTLSLKEWGEGSFLFPLSLGLYETI